ncbi:MAG: AsmA family protein [Pseudomonadota bacterium]
MRQAFKWLAIAAATIIGITGVLIAYVAATFDPNAYKSQIIDAVREKTGRKLQLQGDLRLSLFPSIGAKLGEASLSEPNSTRIFASVSSANISVQVIPLLWKEVVVDAVEAQGLRLNLERNRSGRMNFDDLTGADKKTDEKPATTVKVAISRIDVSNADLTYSDSAAGTRYHLSGVDLRTGRVAAGVTTPLSLSATVTSEKDQARVDTRLKAKLTLDLERQIYKLDGLDFSAKGAYADVADLNVKVKGALEARLATNEYLADALNVSISGKHAGGELKLRLDAPRLTLTRDTVAGAKLVLDATRIDAASRLVAKITISGVQGAYKAMAAGPLTADIETKRGARATKATLNGTLTGNLEAKRFELPQLALSARVSDPDVPGGAFDAVINGAARVDLDRGSAGLNFSGKLAESNVNGKVNVVKFSPFAVTFDLNADQLNADRLMGKAPAGKTADAKPAKGGGSDGKEGEIDLSALKAIDAVGTLRIGKLTLLNLQSSQVRADLKLARGRLELAPISAQLYQGTLNGSVSAQAADSAIFTVKQALAGVAVGPLLRDAAQIDTLEGKGAVNVDLSTRGATVAALKKALNGTAAVNLSDGSVRGIDIAGSLRTARTQIQQLQGKQVQASSKTEKTDFSELKASFVIKAGIAHNEDLIIKSPLLRVSGRGDIDIGNDRMDYLLKASLVATSKGQGGRGASELGGLTVPVRLTGALASPQWSIDFAGIATDLAKQQLQEEIMRRATGQPGSGGPVTDVIKDRLKGIFGR